MLSGGIALLILNLGARWICVFNPCPGHFTPGKRSHTNCRGGGAGPRASLDECEEEKVSFPAGFQTPDRQAHIDSKYFSNYCKICFQVLTHVHATDISPYARVIP